MVPGDSLPLLRPLLGWRRAGLVALVAAAGIAAVDDPSNRDGRFERARVRAGLATAPWLDPAGLAASAGHLAQADSALDWVADRLCADLAYQDIGQDIGPDIAPDIAIARDLPRALALRVLERVVVRLGSSTPRGRDLARWHDRLMAREVATLAGVRGDGRGETWRFVAAPPHKSR